MDCSGNIAYEDEQEVQAISLPNAMEEAAQRYWRASRIWRDKEESTWNFDMMIQECRGILCYRGRVAFLAETLLDDVVHDRRAPVLELQPHQTLIANDTFIQAE